MAKAKYTRGSDGYFKTNVWNGQYKPDGSKQYVPLRSRKSSADLERKKKEYEDAVKARANIRRSDISFLAYAREWKKVYKIGRAYKTREMYDNVIEGHFTAIDGVKLQDISRVHLQMILSNAEGKARVQQQISMTFFQVLASAVSDNLLAPVVYDTIKGNSEPIRYKAKKKRPLTSYEKKAIFDARLDEMDRVFLFLIYGCGIRREECIALTVFDFALPRREVSISRAHEFIVNDAHEKDPKTWNGYRTLPIPDCVFPAIRNYVEKLRAQGRTYLFTTASGKPATKSCYRRMWARILSAMQEVSSEPIHGLTAHIFRHNYCTMLCYQIPKVSIKRIAQLMGDTESVVMAVYNHIVMEREDAVGAVNDAINF